MSHEDPAFVPVPGPDGEADGDPSPAEKAAPVDRASQRSDLVLPTSARAWIVPVVILAVIALTAGWQLLGLWPTIAGIAGLLIVVGAVTKWRQGSRPNLSAVGLPDWSSSRKPGGTPKRDRRRRSPSGGGGGRGGGGGSAKTRPPAGGGRNPLLPFSKRTPKGPQPARAPRPPAHKAPKGGSSGGSGKTSKSGGKINWKRTWRQTRKVSKFLATPLMLIVAGGVEMYQQLRNQEAAPPREPAPLPEEDAQPAAPKPEEPIPVPGPKVDRPTARPSSPSSRPTSIGVCMSAPVQAAVDAIHDNISGAVFSNMADFTAFVSSLDVLLEALHESLGTVNAKFTDDEPVDPRVVDHLEEVRAMLLAPLELARDAGAVFGAAHEADLERLDNPRAGEEKLDYSQQ